MPKTLQGDNIMGCQHGRPQGSPCPHCLGINNPEDNQPQPQESIEERLEEDFPTLWRVMEETEIFGIKMSVRFLVWLKIRFEEALQSQQSLHEAELERVIDYLEHDDSCTKVSLQAGRPTKDGYEEKYRGKWYQSRPIDKTPKCDCGLTDLLKKL